MLGVIAILVKRRRPILLGTAAVFVVSLLICLLLPSQYEATTTILPPEPSASSLSMRAAMSGLDIPYMMGMDILGTGQSLYESILTSRRVREGLVEDLDLVAHYDAANPTQAMQMLASRTRVDIEEDGLLRLSCRDRNPEMAARLANGYHERLDRFNRELQSTRSGRTREFLEGQLQARRRALAAAEESLRVFQEKHGAVELDRQMQAALAMGADLARRKTSLEIELHLMRQFLLPDSPLYQWKRAEYTEAERQLERMRRPGGGTGLIPSMEEMPSLALRFARLLRNLTIEQTVYRLLLEQVEQSRIEEARDMPTVQVLDPAVAPERPAYPRRKWMVGIASLGGFLLLAGGSVVVERYRTRTLGETALGHLDEILAELRRDRARVGRWLGRGGSASDPRRRGA
jgi:tyrosine-protein kinase Etk/Wzc